MLASSSPATAIRLASLVTAVNVLTACGYSIVGLVSPESVLPTGFVPTEASSIFAMYAAARTIPLAVMTLAAIYQGGSSALLVLGSLAGIIQAADTTVGLFQHDMGKSVGPLIIAVLQFCVIYMLKKFR